jgi:hypothetical protein
VEAQGEPGRDTVVVRARDRPLRMDVSFEHIVADGYRAPKAEVQRDGRYGIVFHVEGPDRINAHEEPLRERLDDERLEGKRVHVRPVLVARKRNGVAGECHQGHCGDAVVDDHPAGTQLPLAGAGRVVGVGGNRDRRAVTDLPGLVVDRQQQVEAVDVAEFHAVVRRGGIDRDLQANELGGKKARLEDGY